MVPRKPISVGLGFKDKDNFDRMVKGVRSAERLIRSLTGQGSLGHTSGFGQGRCQVKITSTTAVDGFYPGVFVTRDLDGDGGSVPNWIELPVGADRPNDNKCYVQEFMEEELVENVVYDGYLAGVFDRRDGNNQPSPDVYNGFPLVMVKSPVFPEIPEPEAPAYNYVNSPNVLSILPGMTWYVGEQIEIPSTGVYEVTLTAKTHLHYNHSNYPAGLGYDTGRLEVWGRIMESAISMTGQPAGFGGGLSPLGNSGRFTSLRTHFDGRAPTSSGVEFEDSRTISVFANLFGPGYIRPEFWLYNAAFFGVVTTASISWYHLAAHKVS